tara:strand:- start:3386 stop:5377 length:1992 start_codon:yes stop_codon:yes gene_type:complete
VLKKTILNIAIQTPVKSLFDYSINLDSKIKPEIGQRIQVPFRNKKRLGFIHDISSSSKISNRKLKPFTEIIDETPVIDNHTRDLIKWCSNYYHYPIGMAYSAVVPKYLRESKYPNKIEDNGFIALAEERKSLTNAQKVALKESEKYLKNNSALLLNGVTGSGKTEVYMRLIEKELSLGHQVLFLVPEIGLTPQTANVLTARFGGLVNVIHSGTSPKVRASVWVAAQKGLAQLVVGTRSAIFTPFASLGIIVIDEEHDQSYKQQSGLMYSARDLAVVKAKKLNAKLLLGSATPSFESLFNVKNKKYNSVEINKRVFSTPLPKNKIIDLRLHPINKGLTKPLIKDIAEQINKHKQVLLFLNRRGYAPLTMCEECGHIEECPRCDTSLVLHKTIRLLKCHHCSYQKTQPKLCSKCGSNNANVGKGTQQLEEGLKEQFPNENILRIDRDTTRSKKKRELAMKLAHSGKAKILVGTQMLTKGHDFPNLSMVAIINADQGLFGSGFRSSELFAQQYFQASGRAGRRNERGLVVVQTHNPNHPLLQNIINNNYTSFFNGSIEERINHLWPPFYGAALLRAEAVNKKKVFEFLSKISSFSETLKGHKTLFLGPVSSPIERKLGKYRGQILLLNKNRKKLHSSLNQVRLFIENNDVSKGVRWVIDIDPIDMS